MSHFGVYKRKLAIEEAKKIEDFVESELLRLAKEAKIDDPITRDLLPNEDLGETSGCVWQQSLSALQYRTIYSGENPDDRFFAIYGAKNDAVTPLTTAIRFCHGVGRSHIKDIWQVEDAWVEENSVCYGKSPIIYLRSEGFNIDFHAGPESGTDGVILLGKVAEPKGKVIGPEKLPKK